MFFACSNSLRFFFTRVRLLTIFVLTERVYFFVCSFAPKFVSNVAFDARFVCAREFPAHRRYGGVTLAKGKPDVGRYALLGRLRTHFSQNSVRNRDRFSYTGMLNLISPKIAEKFFFFSFSNAAESWGPFRPLWKQKQILLPKQSNLVSGVTLVFFLKI